jgi:Rieske 2Fe-2S family protein
VYDLDGSLRTTPRYEPPEGFDITAYRLFELPVAQWRGWVFVNASGNAGPLAEHIGGFDALVAPYEPERLVVGATHEYRLEANWKLAIENYHECYHCPVIHPELCRLSPPTSGENFSAPGLAIGGSMELIDGAKTMSLTGESPLPPLPGLSERQQRDVIYAGVFPNLLVSLHPDFVMTHRIEPLEPRPAGSSASGSSIRTRSPSPVSTRRCGRLLGPHEPTGLGCVRRRAAGIASRGYNPGPFSLEEDGVREWAATIARGYLEGAVKP